MNMDNVNIDKSEFSGKNVVVAGGTSGIGLGIAERFADLDANVCVLSRNPDRVSAAARLLEEKGANALGIAADVRDYEAVERALREAYERFGDIDVLVSGAAGNFLAPVIGLSPNAFRTVVEIDLIGTFNVFRASWEFLRRPGASLISITAAQGSRPHVFQAHACAAKAGVN